MDESSVPESPVLPTPVQSPGIPPTPDGSNRASLALKILVFAVTTMIVFAVLALVFRPKDVTKSDNTDGQISRFQCEQIPGKIIILPNGNSGCKIEGAVFSLTD